MTVTQTDRNVQNRPAAAPMIEIAYRNHVRLLNPGDSHDFRLIRSEERNRDDPTLGAPPVTI